MANDDTSGFIALASHNPRTGEAEWADGTKRHKDGSLTLPDGKKVGSARTTKYLEERGYVMPPPREEKKRFEDMVAWLKALPWLTVGLLLALLLGGAAFIWLATKDSVDTTQFVKHGDLVLTDANGVPVFDSNGRPISKLDMIPSLEEIQTNASTGANEGAKKILEQVGIEFDSNGRPISKFATETYVGDEVKKLRNDIVDPVTGYFKIPKEQLEKLACNSACQVAKTSKPRKPRPSVPQAPKPQGPVVTEQYIIDIVVKNFNITRKGEPVPVGIKKIEFEPDGTPEPEPKPTIKKIEPVPAT
jgi:hypothetical protein